MLLLSQTTNIFPLALIQHFNSSYNFLQSYANISVMLYFSLIDRRGFLPPDVIPQMVSSETEIHPFMKKNDTNVVRVPSSGNTSDSVSLHVRLLNANA